MMLLNVEKMSCNHCVRSVTQAVQDVAPAAQVRGGRDPGALHTMINPEFVERASAEIAPIVAALLALGLPGVHDIVEYETRLNHILPKYHDPVVCAYETSKYDGAVIMDILRTLLPLVPAKEPFVPKPS